MEQVANFFMILIGLVETRDCIQVVSFLFYPATQLFKDEEKCEALFPGSIKIWICVIVSSAKIQTQQGKVVWDIWTFSINTCSLEFHGTGVLIV